MKPVIRAARRSARAALILSATLLGLTATLATAGETTNKIGITMVDIPAGSFLMGSCKQTSAMAEENKKRAFLGQAPLTVGCNNTEADARDSETPQHRVSIRAFQMGKTEVTLGQFKKFVTAAGRSDLVNDDFMKSNAYGDNAPVTQVSWHDVQDFIKWLNSIDGGGYRLPSEAEWEYACRAGGSHTYCGGNDLNVQGWYDDNSGNRPHPVGSKLANAFGLHDMSGNVLEWVQECWHENYNGAPDNGSAWTGGKCVYRVMRSGSWLYKASFARAAFREYASPDVRGSEFGFRLVRTR